MLAILALVGVWPLTKEEAGWPLPHGIYARAGAALEIGYPLVDISDLLQDECI